MKKYAFGQIAHRQMMVLYMRLPHYGLDTCTPVVDPPNMRESAYKKGWNLWPDTARSAFSRGLPPPGPPANDRTYHHEHEAPTRSLTILKMCFFWFLSFCLKSVSLTWAKITPKNYQCSSAIGICQYPRSKLLTTIIPPFIIIRGACDQSSNIIFLLDLKSC